VSSTQVIKLLIAALFVIAIVALVVYLVRRRKSGGNPDARSRAGSGSKDFQRLLQKGAPPPPATRVPGHPATPAHGSRNVLTAAQLRDAVKLLGSRGAAWPEILGTLNPSGNKTIADHLIAIRGPHMFAPGVAMQAIQAGCEDVLRSSPAATCVDALVSTRRSLDKIVRADRH
jgi:glycine/D-amino acid oxidase-like deaminating enzyme